MDSKINNKIEIWHGIIKELHKFTHSFRISSSVTQEAAINGRTMSI